MRHAGPLQYCAPSPDADDTSSPSVQGSPQSCTPSIPLLCPKAPHAICHTLCSERNVSWLRQQPSKELLTRPPSAPSLDENTPSMKGRKVVGRLHLSIRAALLAERVVHDIVKREGEGERLAHEQRVLLRHIAQVVRHLRRQLRANLREGPAMHTCACQRRPLPWQPDTTCPRPAPRSCRSWDAPTQLQNVLLAAGGAPTSMMRCAMLRGSTPHPRVQSYIWSRPCMHIVLSAGLLMPCMQ